MRILELYSGIGGLSAALDGAGHEIFAFDQSEAAIATHRWNFPQTRSFVFNIEDLKESQLREIGADLWWMSPPCQPFSIKGQRRDLDDPRTKSFKKILELLEILLPHWVALENVLGFRESKAHITLRTSLEKSGYHILESTWCPSSLGIPNKRPRFYLLASRVAQPFREVQNAKLPARDFNISTYLEKSAPFEALKVPESKIAKFGSAMNFVDSESSQPTFCFASSYGREILRAGSYLKTPNGPRYFSPKEVVNFLHFPKHFCFPQEIPLTKQWGLAGNSVSILAVRRLLSQGNFPPFPPFWSDNSRQTSEA